MSEGEVIVLIGSLVLSCALWIQWLHRVVVSAPLSRQRNRGLLLLGPLAGAAIILTVLCTMAAGDVTSDPAYITMYFVFGAAWVGVFTKLFPLVGFSPLIDAAERGNRAAAVATFGAIIGLSLCYAGCNIGDGPGWWVVLFTGLLATGSLMVLWGLLQAFTGISDLITIERDTAAGVRLATLLMGAGLVMGRGGAGDWHGYDHASADFARIAWPIAVLLLVETSLSALLKPTPENPRPSVAAAGLAPGTIYVGTAVGYTLWLGWPA